MTTSRNALSLLFHNFVKKAPKLILKLISLGTANGLVK